MRWSARPSRRRRCSEIIGFKDSHFIPRTTAFVSADIRHPCPHTVSISMCRRSQSSRPVLANRANSCSDSLTMGRAPCSHYPPLCSPSSCCARQRTIVLTFRANGRAEVRTTPALAGKSRAWLQHHGERGGAADLHPASLFSKAVECSGFRNRVIENSSEKGKCLDAQLRAARAEAPQKPRFMRTPQWHHQT